MAILRRAQGQRSYDDSGRTLPTTPVAVIPRTMGVASASMGAVPVDDKPLDARFNAHVLAYQLALEGL
jgi:hypothetical protein